MIKKNKLAPLWAYIACFSLTTFSEYIVEGNTLTHTYFNDGDDDNMEEEIIICDYNSPQASLKDCFCRTVRCTALDLTGLNVENLNEAFLGLRSLEKLCLNDNKINCISKNLFRELTNLEILELANNLIKKIEGNPFLSTTKLTELNLNGNRLREIPPAIPSLRKLTMDNNQIQQLLKKEFQNFISLTILIYKIEVDALDELPLTEIYLENNKLECCSVAVIQRLSRTHNAIKAVDDTCYNGMTTEDSQLYFPEEEKYNNCLGPCTDPRRFICQNHSTCVSTNDNSYVCLCNSGFLRKGDICEDIDECTSDYFQKLCPLNSKCTNRIGSYTCECLPGYRGNGYVCTDIDECAENIDNCLKGENCTNTIGSYKCSCGTGHFRTNNTCQVCAKHHCATFITKCGRRSDNLCATCEKGRYGSLCQFGNKTKENYRTTSFEKAGYKEPKFYKKDFLIILLPLCCAIFFAAVASCIIVYCIKIKGSKKKKKNEKQIDKFNSPDDSKEYTVWLDPRLIKIQEKVGEGCFGIVYRGTLNMIGYEVAIGIKDYKNIVKSNGPIAMRIENEAKMLMNLSHPNIVKCFGLSETFSKSICLIMEYMIENDLLRRLRRTKEGKYTMELVERLWYCYQAACGMHYLATNRIVHCDLAARNCLLGSSHDSFSGFPCLKISDFGLARVLKEKNESHVEPSGTNLEKLPFQWMAPESIMYRKYSEKSDVWSFGITMWEIFSEGDIPFAAYQLNEMLRLINLGTRLAKPVNCTDAIYAIMLQCWPFDEGKRYSFLNLENALRNILIIIKPSFRNFLLRTYDGYVDVATVAKELEKTVKNSDKHCDQLEESTDMSSQYGYVNDTNAESFLKQAFTSTETGSKR